VGTDPLEKGAGAEVGRQHVRAFFGLPVPEPQRASLADFVAACAQAAPDFRWTPAANLHLTVRFIGHVERAVVEEIAARLAARSLPALDLELGELGTFKRGRLARVVWLGLRSGTEPATRLAAEVEAACIEAGIEAEKRPFQAHLTLARARARDGALLPALPSPDRLGPWRATELVLYSSHLSRTGSVYESLRVVRLD